MIELGGEKLPGRCRTLKEARQKIELLLSGDDRLSERIRTTQPCLLEKMRPEHCAPIWKRNFEKVLASSSSTAITLQFSGGTRRKIAVILPIEYRGGTLRAAKLIATALHLGSRQAAEPADIVFGHLDRPESYPEEEFSDLLPDISRRTFEWESLDRSAAERILRYRGLELTHDGSHFVVPNDGINYFLDCDIWLIISDRLDDPLLPLKPYALVIFDYIQRYQQIMSENADMTCLRAARDASAVVVTTRFSHDDAAQYAGVRPKSIHLVPCLLSAFPQRIPSVEESQKYFIWPINLAPHKNHANSLLALRYYYEMLDGAFQCRITGVESEFLFTRDVQHLKAPRAIYNSSAALKNNLILMGELSDSIYQKWLSGSSFLWHSTLVDNGTFSVVEAASVGVPALSSDYPAMREMNDLFNLNVAWCDPTAPREMAHQLKGMETKSDDLRRTLPSRQSLESRTVGQAASAYWQAVRTCF